MDPQVLSTRVLAYAAVSRVVARVSEQHAQEVLHAFEWCSPLAAAVEI